MSARAEVTLTPGYDVTVNDGRMVDLAAAAARELFGERGFMPMPAPVMGAEDWSYVLQRIPGLHGVLGRGAGRLRSSPRGAVPFEPDDAGRERDGERHRALCGGGGAVPGSGAAGEMSRD